MLAVVMKAFSTKAIVAHILPAKGGDMEWAAQQLVQDLAKWEYGKVKVIIRSDHEPAIAAFVEKFAAMREAEIAVETSPRCDSDANGLAERAVQFVEGQLRSMKLNLEERLGARIPVEHQIIP